MSEDVGMNKARTREKQCTATLARPAARRLGPTVRGEARGASTTVIGHDFQQNWSINIENGVQNCWMRHIWHRVGQVAQVPDGQARRTSDTRHSVAQRAGEAE
ncbi:hypothetical protein HAX54_017782 [Datura stramonium]|uniref:Uncharacterized protein n=1 Tax=Datura stramonium TaxID=4076 RepID=A0ABS8UNH7_DATST|nr:hypothetical protein [Datura stramonium]